MCELVSTRLSCLAVMSCSIVFFTYALAPLLKTASKIITRITRDIVAVALIIILAYVQKIMEVYEYWLTVWHQLPFINAMECNWAIGNQVRHDVTNKRGCLFATCQLSGCVSKQVYRKTAALMQGSSCIAQLNYFSLMVLYL